MGVKIQVKRGTTAQRTAATLANGELGWDETTSTLYVGDGTTAGGKRALPNITKAEVGLGSVDNTADIDKPVSTAQATAIAAKISTSDKGVANGVAPLGSDAKIAAAYLPSYVDDILEYANLPAFPATGTSGIIYVAQDTNKIFRWSGSAYSEISASPGSTDAVTEGATNLYFTVARVRTTLLTGYTTVASAVIAATDSVLDAFQKLQAQITALTSSKADKSGTAFTGAISATAIDNTPIGQTTASTGNFTQLKADQLNFTKYVVVTADSTIQLANHNKMDGTFFIAATGNNREHRLTISVHVNAYSAGMVHILQEYKYGGETVLSNFRFLGSVDGVSRVLVADVANRNLSNITVTVGGVGIYSGVDPKLVPDHSTAVETFYPLAVNISGINAPIGQTTARPGSFSSLVGGSELVALYGAAITSHGDMVVSRANVNAGLAIESLGGAGRRWYWISKTDGSITLFDGTAALDRLHVDSNGNMGLNAVPSTWGAGYKAIEIAAKGTSMFGATSGNNLLLTQNAYWDGANWRYVRDGAATHYELVAGEHKWFVAASGLAGTPIPWLEAVKLNSTNLSLATNLLLGASSNIRNAKILSENVTGQQLALRYTGVATWYFNINAAGDLVIDSDNVDKLRIATNGDMTVKGSVLTPADASKQLGLVVIDRSITLTTSWQATGINGAALATGTYMIQMVAHDAGVGGGQYSEHYSGIMSWYAGGTNELSSNEITLHQAGHAANGNAIKLRTERTGEADPLDLKLMILGTSNTTGPSTYTFTFRRMI